MVNLLYIDDVKQAMIELLRNPRSDYVHSVCAGRECEKLPQSEVQELVLKRSALNTYTIQENSFFQVDVKKAQDYDMVRARERLDDALMKVKQILKEPLDYEPVILDATLDALGAYRANDAIDMPSGFQEDVTSIHPEATETRLCWKLHYLMNICIICCGILTCVPE